MIELKGIDKNYGDLRVLRDVSLDVGEKEILAIVGPSGAGKTTLLQIAGTLDRPSAGSILYDGEEVSRYSDKKLSAFRNSHIGFIFQYHRLLPDFTALENVMMPALIGGLSTRRARERAMELLLRLGLESRASHKPARMSGGECQRVAVARALVNSPRVVFADEPTGSLDSANRDAIQHLITDLNSSLDQTFVVVTHDPSLASIAHRTVTLRDGRIEKNTDQ